MATRREVIGQISFQLGELGAKNAHHDFEHLCRHLARQRICSNILPATGPVSAGGDQGRDAESFRSYLAKNLATSSPFVGLVSDQFVAFACTIQKKDAKLKKKIKYDVKKIVEAGRRVASVHYFCSANVETAFRHDVEGWARENHEIELIVLDGQYLAEELAQRDTFWIASEFLSLPSELFPPPPPGGDGWYEELLDAYRIGPARPLTYATFGEVKSAVRHATFTADRQHDLAFWLQQLATFISEEAPEPLALRAIYESAVASLLGQGTMEGQEDRIRRYFAEVFGSDATCDLEDAAVLTTYCFGAVRNHAVAISWEEVRAIRDSQVAEIERRLATTATPGRTCELLEVLGFALMSGMLVGEPVDSRSPVEVWSRLVDLLPHAPLFPLERFSDHLAERVPFLGEDSAYRGLCHRVDDLLAERVGRFAAAARCRDRAVAYRKQGKLLLALDEAHQAKVKWFAEETIRGSVLTMMFVAECYRELGLLYAAKYYAMAAAWAAIEAHDRHARAKSAPALTLVADCEYRLGNWQGYARTVAIAAMTHWWLAPDPANLDTHHYVDHLVEYAAIVLSLADRLDDELAASIRRNLTPGGLLGDVEELIPAARRLWEGLDSEGVVDLVSSQLGRPPFSDVPPGREAVWHIRGLTWRVHWTNDRETTANAEELVALLQIVQAELARHDLLLLRTEVRVDVILGDVEVPDVQDESLNDGRRWTVVLPRNGEPREPSRRDTDLLGVAMYAVREASLLPEDAFLAVFQEAMGRGLPANAYVVKPYQALHREFAAPTANYAGGDAARVVSEIGSDRPQMVHDELAWIGSLAPGYDEAEARDVISRRYSRIIDAFPTTLARLAGTPEFQASLKTLRAEGWRDWHVLLAIGNIITSHRMRQRSGSRGLLEHDESTMARDMLRLARDDHSLTLSPVPAAEFSIENLRLHLDFSMLATLKNLGLECHQSVPDIPAIRDLLSHRYQYWIDDLDHEDPFRL